tara:strand:+ start:75 stop:1544 length:1470 start_codon:yes stop_codon:yes gene_type:complete
VSEDIFKSAIIHHGKKNFSKAKEIYERLLKINPNNIAVLENFSVLLSQTKDYKKAEEIFKRCLEIKPNDPLVLYNYGKFFHEQKIYDQAIDLYKKSFKIDGNNHVCIYNLGNIYSSLKKFDLSIECFKKSIELNPSNFLAFNNLGFSYKYKGDFNSAKIFYKKSIDLKYDFIEGHLNYSTVLLTLKKFNEGFKEYEWRKKSKIFSDYLNYSNLKITTPIWKGENIKNKTILIFAEQGIGDLFQFSRYLFKLKEQFECNVILRLKHNLSHIFDKNHIRVISEKDKIPNHDFHNHLMSLPGIFYRINKSFLENNNFIQSDKKKLEKWKSYFSSFEGLKVGINADSTIRASATGQLQRMIPIEEFNALTNLKSINFFVLQRDIDKEKIKAINKNGNVNYFEGLDQSVNPFEDTISIIKNLDLIITADTSIAHLSATLERTTWIGLPLICDWRWFLKDSQSIWYKDVTLFRQKKDRDWKEVFKSIKNSLVNKM